MLDFGAQPSFLLVLVVKPAFWRWPRSKACRWEFGYVRKPELVHVYHQGVDGPRIVSWRELTQDVTLCSQVFGAGGAQDVRLEGHMDKVAQSVEETLERIQTFARTVEEQEYQAWCSMPLLEVAYSFSKAQFGEEHDKTVKSLHALSVVYQKTGSAERAGELAAELLKFLEANASDASLSKARDLGAKPELMKLLEENVLAKSSGPGVTLVGGSVSSLHLNVAITLNNLSNAFEKSGAFARQKEILERALRITELHCGSDHWHVAAVLTNLGNAHGHLGDHKQKRDMLMKALKMKELHDGPDHREVGVTLVNLANAYGSLGDPRQQKELAERALKILEQQLGPEHPLVAASLQSLGDALGSLGDCAQQEEMLRRALRIKELQYGPEHPELVNILHHLGRVWRSLGDHGREKEFLLRSLKIRETLPESEKLAKILADLANAFESLKDYAREKEMLERAVEIQEKHGGSKDPELAKLLNNLGSTLGSLGEHIRQKETLERALRIFEQHCGPEHVNVAMTLANLSSAHGALEEHLQKKQVLQRALGIFQQQQHPLADRVRAMLAWSSALSIRRNQSPHGLMKLLSACFLPEAIRVRNTRQRAVGAAFPSVFGHNSCSTVVPQTNSDSETKRDSKTTIQKLTTQKTKRPRFSNNDSETNKPVILQPTPVIKGVLNQGQSPQRTPLLYAHMYQAICTCRQTLIKGVLNQGQSPQHTPLLYAHIHVCIKLYARAGKR